MQTLGAGWWHLEANIRRGTVIEYRQDRPSLFLPSMPMALFRGYQDQGVGADRRCNRIVGGRIFSVTTEHRQSAENAAGCQNSCETLRIHVG